MTDNVWLAPELVPIERDCLQALAANGLTMTAKAVRSATAPRGHRYPLNSLRYALSMLDGLRFAEITAWCDGQPCGWVVTDAGRAALAALEVEV